MDTVRRIDSRYKSLKKLLLSSGIVAENEVPLAALLILGKIVEPYPSEVEQLAIRLVNEGFI